ncbi:hypothetical protein PROFUN_07427 [Planoprotostelium fungivorum]|uniref:THH1/TOM1/TOM3 domain-containing protein n=1 Tax=Planoprotostelium fungivorum TaxID=1890364 RepID=A0A2P6NLD9_9EUKA|nr:hypothetical protein PROFUN_07427 [Planoprotostelium fungivorum]
MLARPLVFFFSVCIFIVTAQTNDTLPTNSTSLEYLPDCSFRNPDCDGRGVCMTRFLGYRDGVFSTSLNSAGLDNCLLRADVIPGFKEIYTNMRIFQGIIFGFLTLIMVYRVILEFVISFTRDSSDVITKYTMILLTFLCLWVSILSGDFFGAFGAMNVKAYYVMYYFKDNLLLFVFSALLFHWAELYYASIRKMKREEMLKKIKPGYEPNLQMEDILLKMSLVSKFRFGYVAVCAVSVLVFIGIVLTELHGRSQSGWVTFTIFYFAFYTGTWILFAVGYITYGLRLLQIIPDVMQGRIKVVMILTGLFSIFGVSIACINIVIHSSHTVSSVATLYALVTLTCLMVFSSVNVFIPLWEWHRWFNPRVIRSMILSTTTTMGNTSEMKTQEVI